MAKIRRGARAMSELKPVNLMKRLSFSVREPNVIPIGDTEPKFANPGIFVQGIGTFYLLGDIPLAKARELRDELEAGLAAWNQRPTPEPTERVPDAMVHSTHWRRHLNEWNKELTVKQYDAEKVAQAREQGRDGPPWPVWIGSPPPQSPDRDRRAMELYHDLLYQVANKIPGETRHETAKRIIRQHETPSNDPECSKAILSTEHGGKSDDD